MGPNTLDERRKKREQPINTMSPAAMPPQSLRMPSRPQAGAGATQGPSPAAPYTQAYQEAGGGPRGAGAVTRTALKRTLVDAPMQIGGKVADYTKWLYSGPAAFTAGLVGLQKPQPTTQAGQEADPPAGQAAPAAAQRPAYFDETQAAKTRAATSGQVAAPAAAPAPAGYTMNNVPEGGGYISWGAPMGDATMAQLAPGQREQFRRPGSLSITPQRASELARQVTVVPSESFARPMASTMEALSNARGAAMDRGDFEGVRRSYLSPEDLQAENQQIRERRALAGRRDKLEARAREPISTNATWGEFFTRVGNRRQAQTQLQQLSEAEAAQRASAGDAAQQQFENQIALMNAQANQTRADASLRKPGKRSVVKGKQYDESGFPVGENFMLFDEESGTLTPLAPELSAPGIIQGQDGRRYMPDPANPGKYLVWEDE